MINEALQLDEISTQFEPDLAGVFETMRTHSGQIILLERHLLRLQNATARLWRSELSLDSLRSQLRAFAQQYPNAVIKLSVGRPAKSTNDKLCGFLKMRPLPAKDPTEGLSVMICKSELSPQPKIAGLKLLDRSEQNRARAELKDSDEGLMRAAGMDRIVCATLGNVFLMTSQGLITPKIDLCGVAGVMRAWLLDSAIQLGIPAHEALVREQDLFNASDAFICNAVRGIRQIRRLQGDTCTREFNSNLPYRPFGETCLPYRLFGETCETIKRLQSALIEIGFSQ
jgi:4-amino-4-deoxychorismate lyase